MTENQIKRFLKSIGKTKSDGESGLRIPQLRAIVADRMQCTLYHNDIIRFNVDDELIEIKKYMPNRKNVPNNHTHTHTSKSKRFVNVRC